MLTYAILVVAILGGVMQASLDRVGVGRVEWLPHSYGAIALMIVSIPLNLLSNLGLIIIVIWSFFALPWLPTLGVVAGTFIVGGLAWGAALGHLRHSTVWDSLLEIGIPLVLVIKAITAGSVVVLALAFLKLI